MLIQSENEIRNAYNKANKILKNTKDGVLSSEIAKQAFKKRPFDGHKGTFGHLYICAGSKGLTGAGIMSSNAAARCGTGLLTLICAGTLNLIFETRLTEVMTYPVKDDNGIISPTSAPDILGELDKASAFIFGPGLSNSDNTKQLAELILPELKVPTLIDADGLNAVAKNMDILNNMKCPVVITPHIGEFSRLTGMSCEDILKDPKAHAKNFAEKYGVTVVLKSHRTVIASKQGYVYENISGNSGMAKGGSGDVLTGIIGSLLSQKKDIMLSACAGVFIHSLCGDMASEILGEYSMLPTDMTELIPYAIKYIGE